MNREQTPCHKIGLFHTNFSTTLESVSYARLSLVELIRGELALSGKFESFVRGYSGRCIHPDAKVHQFLTRTSKICSVPKA